MGVIATSFGVAAVAAVALSLFKGRRHSSFGIASMLLAFWAIANIGPSWIDPWMDALGFYVCLFTYLRRPRLWVGAIIAAFTAQMLTHLIFLTGHGYTRMAILNAFLIVQLVAAASPGGIDALRRFRRWRSDRHRARADYACSRNQAAQDVRR